MKTLYLIGGPMGVGKTAVGQILKRRLPRAVYLDGDWCWDADPFVVTEETKAMALDNIRHLLSGFLRCSEYENVIFTWVMHQDEIVQDVLTGLPQEARRTVSVSLTASEPELIARLEGDIRRGLRTEDVIPRSLARLPLYQEMHTVLLDTTGKSPEQVAEEIAALGPNK